MFQGLPFHKPAYLKPWSKEPPPAAACSYLAHLLSPGLEEKTRGARSAEDRHTSVGFLAQPCTYESHCQGSMFLQWAQGEENIKGPSTLRFGKDFTNDHTKYPLNL